MKSIVTYVVLFAMMVCAIIAAGPAAGQAAGTGSVGVHAQGAALIDVRSGRILYSKHGEKPMRIASLTKIMTAIVAIENGHLSDNVKVGKNAFAKEGSSLYLKLGETMSLEHLLYGLMLRSGNDAANAIAEHVGGSIEGFVFLMNQKASLLGLEHTHFANPEGLDAPDHYASADDMAKLTAYALRNATFRDIVKTKIKVVPNPTEAWDYKWANKNRMLTMYEGADGVKTGFTKLARRCLVSSATRDGRQLAAVTLNDPDDWADHRTLLNYGFSHYDQESLVTAGEPMAKPGLVASRTFVYPLADSEKPKVSRVVHLYPDSPVAVDRFGEKGYVELLLEDKEIGRVPLVKASAGDLTSDASLPLWSDLQEKPAARRSVVDCIGMAARALFGLTG